MRGTLRLVPSDASWPDQFASEAATLTKAIGAFVRDIQHVGSTAVPGLISKPVIDIAVAVESDVDAEHCIAPLGARGYEYRGTHGDDPRRRYFVRDINGLRCFQLHLYILPAAAWEEKLAFRDALRRDAALAAAYAAEKARVAALVAWDKARYSEEKGPFIRRVLDQLARASG